ncbi:MAG: hypothetical protein KAS72_11275 [Phycisphaerales bacterium]|nr:hypothetical protein [Phycisphaerales bacterium]
MCSRTLGSAATDVELATRAGDSLSEIVGTAQAADQLSENVEQLRALVERFKVDPSQQVRRTASRAVESQLGRASALDVKCP